MLAADFDNGIDDDILCNGCNNNNNICTSIPFSVYGFLGNIKLQITMKYRFPVSLKIILGFFYCKSRISMKKIRELYTKNINTSLKLELKLNVTIA